MAKVRFYLQNPKAELTYIRLTFHYTGGRLVYYPGESVEPKHWNPAAERMRKNSPGWQEVNAGLDRLEHLTLEIWRRYRNEGKALPLDLFRAELNAAWKGAPAAVAKPLSLFEFWQTLIDERKYSGNYAPNTYKGAQTSLHKLQAFAASTRRRSYASNEYLRAVREGRSFRPIMDILGMSKESTFLRYVKVDRLQSVADWARGR